MSDDSVGGNITALTVEEAKQAHEGGMECPTSDAGQQDTSQDNEIRAAKEGENPDVGEILSSDTTNSETSRTDDNNEIATAPKPEEPLKQAEEESINSEGQRNCPNEEDKEYAKHITYTKDGVAIYTDPVTNCKYKFCPETQKWLPHQSSSEEASTNIYENEHYRWCSKRQEWIPKETAIATATTTETEHYKWNAELGKWIPKMTTEGATAYDIDEDGNRIYTDKDGTVYFWDTEKGAWFPKIDDDFMARYQMNYGFVDNAGSTGTEAAPSSSLTRTNGQQQRGENPSKSVSQGNENGAGIEKDESKSLNSGPASKRRMLQDPPQWFEIDPEHNTKVYVSNLPLDITLEEFAELMGKCGMIMRDPKTQKYKLKLYAEADGQQKGDGLCDYIKVESVALALKILDEYEYRGHKIRVQRAKFEMRGEYNPALKPKQRKKNKEKLQKIKEKLFDWRPDKMRGERSKHEKIVILKNLFEPELFEQKVELILDYQNNLRDECSKYGVVRKVVIYDRHPEGVAQVNMASPEEADMVIQMLHGRLFGKRVLNVEHWDGKTKYKIQESVVEVEERLSKWDEFLETEEEPPGKDATTVEATSEKD